MLLCHFQNAACRKLHYKNEENYFATVSLQCNYISHIDRACKVILLSFVFVVKLSASSILEMTQQHVFSNEGVAE